MIHLAIALASSTPYASQQPRQRRSSNSKIIAQTRRIKRHRRIIPAYSICVYRAQLGVPNVANQPVPSSDTFGGIRDEVRAYVCAKSQLARGSFTRDGTLLWTPEEVCSGWWSIICLMCFIGILMSKGLIFWFCNNVNLKSVANVFVVWCGLIFVLLITKVLQCTMWSVDGHIVWSDKSLIVLVFQLFF